MRFRPALLLLHDPRLGFLALVLLSALALGGCTPKIGDTCVLSTDCSLQGDRQCDTSQPNGYCTIFDCTPNSCPDFAACILFHPAVPGCPYTDRGIGRTGRSLCMAGCQSDGDCRAGYICADPRKAPWDALNIDDNQGQLVCILSPDIAVITAGQEQSGVQGDTDGGPLVCQADPNIDAALPPLPDAGSPAATDAGDAGDAGIADAASD